jgi:hypothetical protein
MATPYLRDMSRPFFMKGPQYWTVAGQYKV